MAGFEALLLLLVVPTGAAILAIVAGWLTYSDLRARGTIPDRVAMPAGEMSPMGMFIVFPAIVATVVVFGFVLWFLGSDVALDIDSGAGPTIDLANRLFLWTAITFAWATCIVVAAEAWVARARMRQFVSRDFGRVQPLIVIPEVVVIFALIIVFLILGRLGDALGGSGSLQASAVNSVILSLQVFAVSTLAVLGSSGASGRVKDLSGRGFLRAIVTAEIGAFVPLTAFVWTFFQIGSL